MFATGKRLYLGVSLLSIDEYFKNIRKFAEITITNGVEPQDFIENPGVEKSIVDQSLEFRESMLSSDDQNALSEYLVISLFAGQSMQRRLAAFAMAFEITHARKRCKVEKLCEPYDTKQPLFVGAPTLFNRIRQPIGGAKDLELIDIDAVKSLDGSEIYKVGHDFVKLCPYLSPGIVNWAQEKWPTAPTFIRLDAEYYARASPPNLVTEATLVPANPRWLKDFSLRKGMKDFAQYALMDRPPTAKDYAEYWDYHAKKIRRLEVRVERREHNYLTMMIEELPQPDDPSGLMIARCIHLDTLDPASTPLQQVKMQHLDLAINVYEGESRQVRFGQSLQHGKVQDASFRTHLFRIEQTPFVSLFSFCAMFLESKVLVSEWLNELATP